MTDLHALVTYGLIVLTLQIVPGPAVLLTITRSLTGGRKIGLATGLGIAVGDMLHTVAAALGLSALLMSSALAFEIVKYLGVAYLLFLGLRAFFQKTEKPSVPVPMLADPRQAFLQAILAEILNPKTALFFLAFLPQFVHPGQGAITLQLLLLGAIFVVLSILVTSALVFSAELIRSSAPRIGWLRRWQGKIVGGIFMGLGLRLALQQRF